MIEFFEEFNSCLFEIFDVVSLYIPFAACVGLILGGIYVFVFYFWR